VQAIVDTTGPQIKSEPASPLFVKPGATVSLSAWVGDALTWVSDVLVRVAEMGGEWPKRPVPQPGGWYSLLVVHV
jgi:hypothetical protein